MVSFHVDSQRLAIGMPEGAIVVYDIKTATKHKVFERHAGNVTCVAFDARGELLASYSAIDATVRLWKLVSTGFF